MLLLGFSVLFFLQVFASWKIRKNYEDIWFIAKVFATFEKTIKISHTQT